MAGLVERSSELAVLADLTAQAAQGRGAIVRLIGEPGSGKTALVSSAQEVAAEGGLRVLAASAGQIETRRPYGVVRRLFDRALLGLPDDERAMVSAGPARLAVDHLVGGDASPVEQSDLLSSLYWLLDGLASLGPMLLAVDDVQWADEESLLFLGSLRERLRDLPVLVVVAARDVAPHDRGPALATLLADRDATELRPQPLSTDGVRALLARTWGDRVEDAVGSAAAEVTGGNPFLVLALATLLAGGERSADQVRSAVPTSVVDAVAARVVTLGDDDRALLRALGVLEVAPTRVAGELAGLDLARATAAADRLRGTGLLADGPELEFRHALLRAAVTSATAPGVRDQLHREAARLLAGDADLAATHLLAAEGAADPWAVTVLRGAAGAALDAGAPHSAVRLLRRAAAEPPDEATLPGLLLDLGLAEMRTADPVCVATLHAAEPLLVAPEDLARCALALAQAYNFAGFYELAVDVLDTAYAALGSAGADRDLLLSVEAALIGSSLVIPERIAGARERLAARPDLTGETPGERDFLLQQMANAVGVNQPAAVIRDLAKRALSDTDTPESTDWAWARLFIAAIGDFDEVRRLTDEGFARAAATGSVMGFVSASFVRGFTEYAAGDLVAAEEHYRAMLEHADALAHGVLAELLGNAGVAQSLGMQGRLDEALAVLAGFPEELPPDSPVNGVAAMTFARGIVRQLSGDFEGALSAADLAGAKLVELDVDSPTWAAWRALAIGPLRAVGRVDEARQTAADHVRLCEQSGVSHLLGEALLLSAQVSDDPAEAIELLRRSIDVLADSQGRIQPAQAQIALGAALRRAGQRSEAREHLLLGRALALECGAGGLAQLAEDELAASGARVRRLEVTGVAALTGSERRVAELAAQGLRNAEIASQLFVSTKTVETHLSHTYRKLGVAGRDGLVQALANAD